MNRIGGLLITVLLLTALVAPRWGSALCSEDGLTVVVTFQFILEDVRGLICDGDRVESLIPPGIDPHDYQLAPKDVEKLSKANLIISTAHTPFETKIREMILEGELRATLIEIPDIPNTTLLINPSTGIVNVHGILFHGNNYVRFIANVSSTLARLRPACAEVYRSKAERAALKVEGYSASKPLRGFKAVISEPVLQYLVVWLGADVIAVLRVEHDVPITPSDIARVEEALEKHRDSAVIIAVEGGQENSLLRDMASRYGVPIVALPNPITSTTSVAEYLSDALNRFANTTIRSAEIPKNKGTDALIILATLLVVAFVVLMLALHRLRR